MSASPTFTRDHTIRFSECDPAAIVFYPQYFVLFNDLVEAWFEQALDIPYQQMVVQRRVGLPTVNLQVDFQRVSRMGDPVKLVLAVERLGGRSLILQLRCEGEDGTRMTMRQVLVFTSLDTHRAIDPPADLRAAIARFAPTP